MDSRLGVIVITGLFLCLAQLALAAEPEKVNPEAAEMTAELIGAPVFSSDGMDVGEVADIKFDDKLQPHSLHITTAATLGLGIRTVEVPQDAFMALRGAVALRMPAEAVQALPEVAKPHEK
jgi:sporulation protein YlmC with PRC-barrel domain